VPQLGLGFDPWQADLNRCILGEGPDGLYAADTVVISIPRQVGKTWDIGALVFADCIINPARRRSGRRTGSRWRGRRSTR
jgi:hypothetical protein